MRGLAILCFALAAVTTLAAIWSLGNGQAERDVWYRIGLFAMPVVLLIGGVSAMRKSRSAP